MFFNLKKKSCYISILFSLSKIFYFEDIVNQKEYLLNMSNHSIKVLLIIYFKVRSISEIQGCSLHLYWHYSACPRIMLVNNDGLLKCQIKCLSGREEGEKTGQWRKADERPWLVIELSLYVQVQVNLVYSDVKRGLERKNPLRSRLVSLRGATRSLKLTSDFCILLKTCPCLFTLSLPNLDKHSRHYAKNKTKIIINKNAYVCIWTLPVTCLFYIFRI